MIILLVVDSKKDLVQKGFGSSYSITWNPTRANSRSVHLINEDDCCEACLDPTPAYKYILTLKDGGRVHVRPHWGEVRNGEENPAAAAAANEAQLASRIENQLMNNTWDNSALVAATVVASPPQVEAMIREDAEPATQTPTIADEVTKLKSMFDDGTLTKEEFQHAKKKVIFS